MKRSPLRRCATYRPGPRIPRPVIPEGLYAIDFSDVELNDLQRSLVGGAAAIAGVEVPPMQSQGGSHRLPAVARRPARPERLPRGGSLRLKRLTFRVRRAPACGCYSDSNRRCRSARHTFRSRRRPAAAGSRRTFASDSWLGSSDTVCSCRCSRECRSGRRLRCECASVTG